MSRAKKDEVSEAAREYRNLGRTTIFLVGVSAYKNLEVLRGPSMDMEMMNQVFCEDLAFSCYEQKQVINIEEPTCDEFRKNIIEYVKQRSAIGDILILYFTGHGCVLYNGNFGFCFIDSVLGRDNNCVLPSSSVSIEEVVLTLSNYDIHPLFIIDACFSNATAPNGYSRVQSQMDLSVKNHYSETYGLIASCNELSTTRDTTDGGIFTQGLYQVFTSGLEDKDGKRAPYIDIKNVSPRIISHFTHEGIPLPHITIGENMPNIPLVKNITHSPLQVKFTSYFRPIIELLWNQGNPQKMQLSELLAAIGPGAYANHSKLALPPWALVQDAENSREIKLTRKGEQFAKGEFPIPKTLYKDFRDNTWKVQEGTEEIYFVHPQKDKSRTARVGGR